MISADMFTANYFTTNNKRAKIFEYFVCKFSVRLQNRSYSIGLGRSSSFSNGFMPVDEPSINCFHDLHANRALLIKRARLTK